MHFKWDRAFSGMLTSLVAVLGLSSSLHAASNDRNQTKEKPGPFAFVFPKDLNLTNPIDFYVSGEALIFQAQQDGLDFVFKNQDISETALVDATVVGFSGKNENWDYNVGARVNSGFNFNHDAWNLDFTWTWYHGFDGKKVHGYSLVPLWLNEQPTLLIRQQASGKWDCKYNMMDAHLAKPYHVSRMLIFNPHFGLRGGWINQTLSADFDDFTQTSTSRTLFHGKNNFWGIGPRVGIDTSWLLGCEWKLFCNVAASVLAGTFNTAQKVDYPSSNLSSRSFTHDFNMNVPNFDVAVGFDWGFYFFDKKYYLDLMGGYEFQVWWDQFNLKNLNLGNATQGNFTLNGFTFKMQLDM